MHAQVILPILLALAMFLLGYVIIRSLNLHLPMARNFRELVMTTFWIFPESWDKKRIRANRIAWLLVVIVTYITVMTIFF